jgi:hypothetical protein
MRHLSLYMPGGVRPALPIPRNWMKRSAIRERCPDYAGLRSALFPSAALSPEHSVASVQYLVQTAVPASPRRRQRRRRGSIEDVGVVPENFNSLDPGRRANTSVIK